MLSISFAARRPHPRHAAAGMSALPSAVRWWVMLCLVSVLGFQSLGLVHRTLHGGSAGPRVSLSASLSDTSSAGVSFKSPSLGHLPGSIDCQLLDQLSTALGPVVQALAWTALLPDHPVATPQPHSATVAQVWRLPARAPPSA
ncbi:hypothetical protein [Roseateles terrae]|uniref:DUF2946 domain-containing protein n=1 Tax=Roseateles terrae TaxID=431060 RepID=A0ABR6GLM9_9BURK|nr:hypothetical protein [Roseateles terrae]MBB3193011.1 hypothetical protein [Roseateles terrae]OWQ89746.1 hypothetical protein CDN98_04320 [Roseateles terrae]